MTSLRFNRPRLPTHYYVWSEPPDAAGDESLHFASERRRIKLKGHSFREFERRVIPLLDGMHTLEEIGSKVEDVFEFEDLEAGIRILQSQDLLEDGPADEEDTGSSARLVPQFNFFHEAGLNVLETQRKLRSATVTVFGLSGAGAALVDSLAATGVGTIRCVDSLKVCETDLYLSQVFHKSDVGSIRSIAMQRHVAARFADTRIEVVSDDLPTDEAVVSAIDGSDFVVCCLDPGQSSLIYKVNRACLETGIRWTSCMLSGREVTVGPTIHPLTTPCYLCFKMRIVACAGQPEDAFSFEKLLDRRKKDDSCRRENLVFGAGLAANLLALETSREIVGLSPVPTQGKVVIFDLLDMSCSKHVVLRKPWCPACFEPKSEEKIPQNESSQRPESL